jgi:hypothetical protein
MNLLNLPLKPLGITSRVYTSLTIDPAMQKNARPWKSALNGQLNLQNGFTN